MHMKNYAFSRLFLLCGLVALASLSFAQAPKFKDAVAYNDYIVLQQTQVGEKIVAFNDAIADAENSAEVVRASHLELLNQTKLAVKNLEAMGGYQGYSKLRDAALALYQFYERMVDKQYKEMMEILLLPAPGEAEIARLGEILQLITEEEKVLDETYLGAQEEFAKMHNFVLEAPEDPFEEGSEEGN